MCKGIPKKLKDNTCGARAINDKLEKAGNHSVDTNIDSGYPLSGQKNSTSNRTSTGGVVGSRK